MCGDLCCSHVNVLTCMHTGTLRMVLEDCQVWFKLLKNQTLIILAKCITGEGLVLPRGQLDQSSLSSFLPGRTGRGWGEEGRRDVYVSVKCSSCMDQAVQTVINTNQTDGLGAWEAPCCVRQLMMHQAPNTSQEKELWLVSEVRLSLED